jgi:hypothetical protein
LPLLFFLFFSFLFFSHVSILYYSGYAVLAFLGWLPFGLLPPLLDFGAGLPPPSALFRLFSTRRAAPFTACMPW